jgi:hypothetical protein
MGKTIDLTKDDFELKALNIKLENGLKDIDLNYNRIVEKNTVFHSLTKDARYRGVSKNNSIFGALLVASALLGNRVYLKTNKGRVNPNIFVLQIGESGSGKDNLKKMMDHYCTNIHMPISYRDEDSINKKKIIVNKLGEKLKLKISDMTTESSLSETLASYRSGYIIYDEYEKVLKTKSDAFNNIENMLTRTFNNQDVWQKNYKSNGPLGKLEVNNPTITLLASIQPELFLKYIGDRIENGSMARFIQIPLKYKKNPRFSVAAVSKIDRYHEQNKKDVIKHFYGEMEILDLTNNNYMKEIKFDDDAFLRASKYCSDSINNLIKSGLELELAMCNKAYGEYLYKIALLVSFLNKPFFTDNIKITLDDVEKSILICDALAKSMVDAKGTIRLSDKTEQDVLSILKNLKKQYPEKWFSVAEIKNQRKTTLGVLPDDIIYRTLTNGIKRNQIEKLSGARVIKFKYTG